MVKLTFEVMKKSIPKLSSETWDNRKYVKTYALKIV